MPLCLCCQEGINASGALVGFVSFVFFYANHWAMACDALRPFFVMLRQGAEYVTLFPCGLQSQQVSASPSNKQQASVTVLVCGTAAMPPVIDGLRWARHLTAWLVMVD